MDTNTYQHKETVDWTDLGREMWNFLTGSRARISYEFDDVAIEVPRDTGPDAPRATWKIDGTVRVSSDVPAGNED